MKSYLLGDNNKQQNNYFWWDKPNGSRWIFKLTFLDFDDLTRISGGMSAFLMDLKASDLQAVPQWHNGVVLVSNPGNFFSTAGIISSLSFRETFNANNGNI